MTPEDLIGQKFKLWSDGFVYLVGFLGNDEAIVQGARVSYGKGTKSVSDDRNLIRYLMRHGHGSPLELVTFKFHIRLPMDVMRQVVRHRMCCLAGDTILHFDLPSAVRKGISRRHNISVEGLYNRFQDAFKRKRVKRMYLRSLDEQTNAIYHTNITDIQQTGIKSVYGVILTNNTYCNMTLDHRCFTDRGWLTLGQILEIKKSEVIRIASISLCTAITTEAKANIVDPSTEVWRPVVGWEDYYTVSTQGRVRRIKGGRGSRSYGRYKALTLFNARTIVSLNRPGYQDVEFVHRLMAAAFLGPAPGPNYCVCHINDNSLDNRIENLRWGTAQDNSNDRIKNGNVASLSSRFYEIKEVKKLGEQMTYDIAVSGPYHNFSAGGIVVHNSLNEYSTRYSEAIDSTHTTEPGAWRLQSTVNKQGSDDFVTNWPYPNYDTGLADPPKAAGEYLTAMENYTQGIARETYNERLRFGVSREQARKDLPLSTYTEIYWQINMRSLLNFLSLRMDSHAQLEIRELANRLYEIAKVICPHTIEAFDDYDSRRGGLLLSAHDLAIIRALYMDTTRGIYGTSLYNRLVDYVKVYKWTEKSREFKECVSKLNRLGILHKEDYDV